MLPWPGLAVPRQREGRIWRLNAFRLLLCSRARVLTAHRIVCLSHKVSADVVRSAVCVERQSACFLP